jgi:hypothetical protein
MSTVARTKPFWKTDAFWLVVMPTALVAIPMCFALIAKALGH